MRPAGTPSATAAPHCPSPRRRRAGRAAGAAGAEAVVLATAGRRGVGADEGVGAGEDDRTVGVPPVAPGRAKSAPAVAGEPVPVTRAASATARCAATTEGGTGVLGIGCGISDARAMRRGCGDAAGDARGASTVARAVRTGAGEAAGAIPVEAATEPAPPGVPRSTAAIWLARIASASLRISPARVWACWRWSSGMKSSICAIAGAAWGRPAALALVSKA